MMISARLRKTFTTACLISIGAFAQLASGAQFDGEWSGTLTVTPQQSIEMQLHISKNPQGYKATIDVPAQQSFGLAFNEVNIDGNKIELFLQMANIRYIGTLDAQQIKGTYTQGGFSAPLAFNLMQNKAVTRAKKPQEPDDNVPYTSKAVTFGSLDGGHQLSGVLSMPKGKIKSAAILLSGSGPTTKDADIAGHKIFLVLADQLTRQGIAILRYDDRGVGLSSGDFAAATSKDFADDAVAAYRFLAADAHFANRKVGLIGHSEGGLIGAIAAAKESEIDFLVTLAGPGTSGAEVLIDQSNKITRLMGATDEQVKQSDKAQRAIVNAIAADADFQTVKKMMLAEGMSEQKATGQAQQMTSDWFRYFVKTDPKTFLAKLQTPVLALNGELDVQVLAKKNLEGIRQAVASPLLTVKSYPGLNHLFQPATTGLPAEYAKIEVTFSANVSDDIANWVNKQ